MKSQLTRSVDLVGRFSEFWISTCNRAWMRTREIEMMSDSALERDMRLESEATVKRVADFIIKNHARFRKAGENSEKRGYF